MKIFKLTLALILCSTFLFQPASSHAFLNLFGEDKNNAEVKQFDLNQCNYDDILYGTGQLTVNKNTYAFNFDTEMDSYTFVGSTSEAIFGQIQDALTNAKPDIYGLKSIALFTNSEELVCASAFESSSLYIQPNILEKDTHYVVGVCTPETSDCWKMKISKSSYLASTLRSTGTLPEEGKVCILNYLPNDNILSLYEDMNFANESSQQQEESYAGQSYSDPFICNGTQEYNNLVNTYLWKMSCQVREDEVTITGFEYNRKEVPLSDISSPGRSPFTTHLYGNDEQKRKILEPFIVQFGESFSISGKREAPIEIKVHTDKGAYQYSF